jgi:hypothetical protein
MTWVVSTPQAGCGGHEINTRLLQHPSLDLLALSVPSATTATRLRSFAAAFNTSCSSHLVG